MYIICCSLCQHKQNPTTITFSDFERIAGHVVECDLYEKKRNFFSFSVSRSALIIIHNKHGVGCCLIFLLLLSGCVPASAASVRLIVSSSSGRNPKQDSPPSLPSPIEKHNTTTQRERERKKVGGKKAPPFISHGDFLSLF